MKLSSSEIPIALRALDRTDADGSLCAALRAANTNGREVYLTAATAATLRAAVEQAVAAGAYPDTDIAGARALYVRLIPGSFQTSPATAMAARVSVESLWPWKFKTNKGKRT